MAKYKLTGTVANRVDVCSTCDEAWLDSGEWELLEALQLSHELPAILTDAWQRRIRREQSEGTRRSILVRLIGEEGTSRVEEFSDWLGRNQHKSHVLAYLYRRIEGAGDSSNGGALCRSCSEHAGGAARHRHAWSYSRTFRPRDCDRRRRRRISRRLRSGRHPPCERGIQRQEDRGARAGETAGRVRRRTCTPITPSATPT